jgi:protein SCO1
VLLAPRGHDEQAFALTDGWAGALRPPGLMTPPFRLRDQDGRVVTDGTLRGAGPVVVAFIYSHCQDTCPAEVQTIRGALNELGRAGHSVQVIGVSVDPANDTPASAKAFMLEQHMTGRMRFLLGSAAALAPVWERFGVQPQRDGKEHSAQVVLLDPAGRQRIGFPYAYLTQRALAHDLRRLS